MVEFLLMLLTRVCSGVIVHARTGQYRMPGVVYFANHTSHLDLLAVLSVFPAALRRNISPVAAADYWGRGWLRRYIAQRVLRAILIDREHPAKVRGGMRRIVEALEDGRSVLIFPEGTRRSGEAKEIGRFRGGIHLLAELRPKTVFVPILLEGFARTLPKGEFLPAPNMGHVTFGEPLIWDTAEGREDFLKRCRQSLLAAGKGGE